jgi:hypothetical protein
LESTHGDRLADFECHQILADHQWPAVGLSRFSGDVGNAWRREFFSAEENKMRVSGELRFGLVEYVASLGRRRVVPDNSLDAGFLHQFRRRACDFVHQQVGASAI